MAKKQQKLSKRESANFPRRYIPILAEKTEEEGGRNYAAMATSPELAAYRVIDSAEKNSGIAEQLDVPTMLAHLREQFAAVNQGDLAHAEAMLMNQATALQSLFARLAERGMGCDQVPAFEANMKMALRAQSQCRATLETLSAIKNPPVVYARQANVTSGPQQINNITPAQSRARENKKSQSKQSGAADKLLPHTRAPSLTGEDDSTLETAGEIDRAKIARR